MLTRSRQSATHRTQFVCAICSFERTLQSLATPPISPPVASVRRTAPAGLIFASKTRYGAVQGRRYTTGVRQQGLAQPEAARTNTPGPFDTQALRSAIRSARVATTRAANQDPPENVDDGHNLHASQVGVQARRRLKTKRDAPMAWETISAKTLTAKALDIPQPPIPNLAHGLDRVLFNPGVYQLQDSRTRVYNFDPYLAKVIPATEFDYSALKPFQIASKDPHLLQVAQKNGASYYSSTSSSTGVLSHFHYLISHWRLPNFTHLSKGFEGQGKDFSLTQKGPVAVFMRNVGDDHYAVDVDKSYDSGHILSLAGRSLEKLLTLPKEVFEQYRISNSDKLPAEKREKADSYNYTVFDKILIRSQLDAHDPRLPGTGTFDLKTRAVVSIRMDIANRLEDASSYQIRSRFGTWSSYEREHFDMIRAALLKYSLQVRMGRMDGIFVAYHNLAEIFGFQYLSLQDMDHILHGQRVTFLGDQELNVSMYLLRQVLDRAKERFPGEHIQLHFETRGDKTPEKAPKMFIFAEPITEEAMNKIQEDSQQRQREFEKKILSAAAVKGGEVEQQHPDEPHAATVDADAILNVTEPAASDGAEDALQADVDESINGESVDSRLKSSAQELLEDRHSRLEALQQPLRWLQEHTEKIQKEVEDQTLQQQGAPGSLLGSSSHVNPATGQEEGATRGQELLRIISTTGAVKADFQDVLRDVMQDLADAEDATPYATFLSLLERVERQLHDQMKDNARLMVSLGISTQEDSIAARMQGKVLDQQALKNAAGSGANTTSRSNNSSPNFDPARPLLGLVLTVQNKVDGHPVDRPEKLRPHQNWEVEYSFEEIDPPELAWSLYEKTRARRAKVFREGRRDEKDLNEWYGNDFMRIITRLSQEGRVWREKQDRIEKGKPVVVFKPRMGGDDE